MQYIDSNIFILAAIDSAGRGDRARNRIENLVNSGKPFATSSLTFGEIMWTLMRHTDRGTALQQAERVMGFSGLIIVNAARKEVAETLRLMAKYRSMKPRDAMHLACALSAGSDSIISDDEDFKAIDEVVWERP
ncbi:MAG: type II toxin-antitoxin system VapC family toxin [Candidatus Aenigmarchaeota archaeon]|nr:type II toxin-antitoxin system VapC family toxin [Candidatus Aenigmarchaeota archaeon]